MISFLCSAKEAFSWRRPVLYNEHWIFPHASINMQCDQRVLGSHVPEHAVVKVMLEQFTLAFEMLLIHWLLSRIIHDHTHYTYTILTQKQCHSLGTFTAVKSLDHLYYAHQVGDSLKYKMPGPKKDFAAYVLVWQRHYRSMGTLRTRILRCMLVALAGSARAAKTHFKATALALPPL